MDADHNSSSDGTPSSSSQPNPAVNFEFVLNDEHTPTQVRRHAMRASWRERKSQTSQKPDRKAPKTIRTLAPAYKASSQTGSPGEEGDRPKLLDVKQNIVVTDSVPGFHVHIDASSAPDSNNDQKQVLVNNVVEDSEDNVESLRISDKALFNTRSGQLQLRDTQAWAELSKTIGSNCLDALSSYPFQIELEDLEVISHWVGSFPEMMFGTSLNSAGSSSQHTHSDVWIPLEFSNEASFHGVMAYAAAHLGHLRGDAMTPLALKHNIKAIELINGWLHDPSMMTSDAAIAAVVRQTSFENWWGNGESIKIHREGLKRMLELRGGLPSLSSNWRLEKAVHSLLLVKEPYWFCPERHRSLFPPIPPDQNNFATSTTLENSQSLRNACHKFVRFFKRLKILQATKPDASCILSRGQYPFIEFAITRLKTFARYPIPIDQKLTPHTYIEETIRVVTLVYLVVMWSDYLSLPECGDSDFEELNAALELKAGMKGYRWVNSVENIFTIVTSGMGVALTNPTRSSYVIQLMDVVRLLDFALWMRVKEILFDTLLGNIPDENDGRSEIHWDEEMLYWGLLDRY